MTKISLGVFSALGIKSTCRVVGLALPRRRRSRKPFSYWQWRRATSSSTTRSRNAKPSSEKTIPVPTTKPAACDASQQTVE
jgi:hypothetical protein